MKKSALILLYLSLTVGLSTLAQRPNTAFDSILQNVSRNIAQNPIHARHIADSLLINAQNENEHIRSRMLIAQIYSIQEQRNKAISEANIALIDAEKINDYNLQSGINGFLGMQYRLIGLLDRGRYYLEKTRFIASKINDKNEVAKILARTNQELGDLEMEENHFEKAREYFGLAILSYEQEEDPMIRDFNIANILEIVGRSYMAQKQPDLALPKFLEAEKRIIDSGAEESLYAVPIYRALGKYYLEHQTLEKSEFYLLKAVTIAESANHLSASLSVYEVLMDLYSEKKDFEKSNYYTNKFKEGQQTIVVRNKRDANEEFQKHFPQDGTQEEQPKKFPKWIMHIGLLTFSIAIGLWFMLVKKRNTTYDDRSKTPEPTISDEKREEILKKLKSFEKQQGFLEKDVSFSKATNLLETNAVYFRHLLKAERENKDFNTYINDLRIHYILYELRTNDKIRTYKINQLADISGFSSHSNFSANFKRVTGTSPSQFIEQLKTAEKF